VTKSYLTDLPREKWFEIRMRNEDVNKQLESLWLHWIETQKEAFEKKFEEQRTQG
jgi:DNA-directed RNA polymerase subunit beta